MKNINDYLHLYLGCNFYYGNNPLPFVLKGILPNRGQFKNPADKYQLICFDADGEWDSMPLDHHFKPILRPLSSMTQEEEKEWLVGCSEILSEYPADEYECNKAICDGHSTKWLISKHFDLFGLIEAGLAIDATTLKEPV